MPSYTHRTKAVKACLGCHVSNAWSMNLSQKLTNIWKLSITEATLGFRLLCFLVYLFIVLRVDVVSWSSYLLYACDFVMNSLYYFILYLLTFPRYLQLHFSNLAVILRDFQKIPITLLIMNSKLSTFIFSALRIS